MYSVRYSTKWWCETPNSDDCDHIMQGSSGSNSSGDNSCSGSVGWESIRTLTLIQTKVVIGICAACCHCQLRYAVYCILVLVVRSQTCESWETSSSVLFPGHPGSSGCGHERASPSPRSMSDMPK